MSSHEFPPAESFRQCFGDVVPAALTLQPVTCSTCFDLAFEPPLPMTYADLLEDRVHHTALCEFVRSLLPEQLGKHDLATTEQLEA